MSEENKTCDETGHWGMPRCYCGALQIADDGSVTLSRGIKVYANANEAVYKDADHVHLTWREDRIVSDTHTATLVDVRKL